MTAPSVQLVLDAPTAHYRPGEQLRGRYLVDGQKPWAVRSAELSVLWYTAGKGEEDMDVHYFERLVDEPGRPLDLRVPRQFATTLPQSPLSYEGEIVKICWCARLRLFLPQGQESLVEVGFRLGEVAAAIAAEPEASEQASG